MKIIQKTIKKAYENWKPNPLVRCYHSCAAFDGTKMIEFAQNNPIKMSTKAFRIGQRFNIPKYLEYPYVHSEIINAGGKVNFKPVKGKTIKGAYQLEPTNIWDSALTFTADMYKPGTHMCISFTGPYKHFKLSKGGAILTDNEEAYFWFKRARYSGRRECSYHEDNFDMLGWNFYMMPELAARGLLLMNQFYTSKGQKKHNEDLELPYPDLSQFKVYTKANRE